MSNKTYELDKICRVCLVEKKDMRPLFGELVADMLMEIARVEIENTDGWPDKICIQCVHQVSRCHAFKMRVEKSDEELRNYIKSLTVIMEDVEEEHLTDINRQTNISNATSLKQQHVIQQSIEQTLTTQSTQREIQQITSTTSPSVLPITLSAQSSPSSRSIDIPNNVRTIDIGNTIRNVELSNVTRTVDLSTTSLRNMDVDPLQSQQVVISNGNIHNAQIIGQICGQPITQIVLQNGQPAQLLQIQRTSDDRCEIIVQQSSLQDEEQYFEDVVDLDPDELEHAEQNIIQIPDDVDEIELDEEENATHISHEELTFELEPEISETEPETEIEQELELEPEVENDEEEADPQYIAEFINSQITCLGPGQYACNLCRKEFKQVKWLQTHMKSHSNWIKANCKKQPQCQICGRSFKGPGMLRMHMKTHETVEKIPTCSICEKTFNSKTILYRHRQTHQQKSYQCGNCLKHFSSPYTLSSHMVKKHTQENPKFQCSQCEELFDAIGILKTHMQQTGHSIHISKTDYIKAGSS
ncbi:zinc finger protein 813 [Condylostylus longicornis]|uniref:zinc finger protein 813 n=1 Tax=Condylostylus longicornis TaxID=2530218 RepID=UPI00244DADAD|nr:zinc finger protein 813 [Condylostylus longicornis]